MALARKGQNCKQQVSMMGLPESLSAWEWLHHLGHGMQIQGQISEPGIPVLLHVCSWMRRIVLHVTLYLADTVVNQS